jgi:hypothetical protein
MPLAFHLGHEADHSPPSSAEVKEWVELYLHSPNMPSWHSYQLGGAQRQLYLYLLKEMFCISLDITFKMVALYLRVYNVCNIVCLEFPLTSFNIL